MSGAGETPHRGRCPVCRRPTAEAWRPFCSKRCADVDLGRWLGEVYRIPAEGDHGEDGEDGDGVADPPSDEP